jgi:hypothetical protein
VANVKIVEGSLSIAYNEEKKADFIRNKRNKLLLDTDWTQLADSPLSEEKKETFRAYRQALRDITEQEGFPQNIVWPTCKPGWLPK